MEKDCNVEREERVLRLLLYLDQHGFGVAYELWQDRPAVVWVVRPIDKPAPRFKWQEACQEQLYLHFSRQDLQVVQKNPSAASSIKKGPRSPRCDRGF